MRPRVDPQVRFFAKVRQDGDCWVWTGHISRDGYAHFNAGDLRQVMTHRWSWEFFRGPIPDGLVLDHLCRNRSCVNPDHMDVVTSQVNILRGEGVAALNAKKTSCPFGHPYIGRMSRTGRPYRACLRCQALASHEYKLRLKTTTQGDHSAV